MKLVLILSVIFPKILLVNVLQIVKIVRAFRVHALMKDEVLALFLRGKCFSTVRIAESELLRKEVFFWDIARLLSGDRPNLFAVAMLQVRDQKLPVPFMLVELDCEKFIYFNFLVFGGMGIIKSPLLERDISADKI